MPHHPRPRRHDGAALEADLLAAARQAGDLAPGPTVVTIVRIADPAAANEFRGRQRAAIVRLLRQAVELRRAA